VISHEYKFTLSKIAGFICLAYAGWLIYLGQYEESGIWGMSGMGIFSVKNWSDNNERKN